MRQGVPYGIRDEGARASYDELTEIVFIIEPKTWGTALLKSSDTGGGYLSAFK